MVAPKLLALLGHVRAAHPRPALSLHRAVWISRRVCDRTISRRGGEGPSASSRSRSVSLTLPKFGPTILAFGLGNDIKVPNRFSDDTFHSCGCCDSFSLQPADSTGCGKLQDIMTLPSRSALRTSPGPGSASSPGPGPRFQKRQREEGGWRRLEGGGWRKRGDWRLEGGGSQSAQAPGWLLSRPGCVSGEAVGTQKLRKQLSPAAEEAAGLAFKTSEENCGCHR